MAATRELEFRAIVDPGAEELRALESLAPYSPLNTAAYAAARRTLGERPALLGLFVAGAAPALTVGCLALEGGGRLTRTLEIPSWPTLDEPQAFWDGVRGFCRARGVWDLAVSTFGSVAPRLPGDASRSSARERFEFVLDLTREEPIERPSTNHARNIKRAERAGLRVERTRDASAADAHVLLMGASMHRRLDRGEAVAAPSEVRPFAALLESGVGELFRVRAGDEVLSSMLVLRSREVGYYHSAGTSPEGMKLGASPFLVRAVAHALRAEGLRELNLGGAEPENAGLYRFKSGFGAAVRPLEAARYRTAHPALYRARSVARTALRDPRRLVGRLVSVERFAVYAARPSDLPSRDEPEGVTVRRLDATELRGLEADPDYGFPARKRTELGFDGAYGLYLDGRLAHVAWLIDAEHDRNGAVRNVKLRPGEAEITHCVTGAGFRGRGVYPVAIRHLARVAAERGVERLFMITNVANAASRRGIEKAGLARRGTIRRVLLPWLSRSSALTLRGHRMGR